MRIIGLTGGIASGKSTVGRMLRARGICVVDADELAREAVAPGSPALERIRARFGDAVVARDGTLDRAALGAIVFTDAAARTALNAITHPEVARLAAERFARLAAEGRDLVVYEVPLLFENNLEALMDRTVLVACSAEQQLARVQARDGLDEAAARARIAAQMPLEEKRKRASVVIENDADLATLTDRVDAVWRAIEAVQPPASGS